MESMKKMLRVWRLEWGGPRGSEWGPRGRREGAGEAVFQEKLAVKFPNWWNYMEKSTQLRRSVTLRQKTNKPLNRCAPRYIVLKLQKTKDKGKGPKCSWRIKRNGLRGNGRLRGDVSSQRGNSEEDRRMTPLSWWWQLIIWPKILYPVKVSFGSQGKIKTFLDK